LAGLYDELRSGRPRSIEDEQIAALLKRTLSRKPTGGTHWSIRQAAQASGISRSSVHRLFQTFALQPHRSRSQHQAVPRWAGRTYSRSGCNQNSPFVTKIA
jgi:putative transposase